MVNVSPQEVTDALLTFKWCDPHTHVDARHLAARGLDDILLYHMSISELYAAGCPDADRIPENRTRQEAHARLRRAIPFLPHVRNTAIAWAIRIILRDLYQWVEPVTIDNFETLDDLIFERSRDNAWPREILRKAGVGRVGTELWRGHDGSADDFLQYALEWGFFARTQWGQPDISVYELERCWNDEAPSPPVAVTFERATAPPLSRTIHSVEDVHRAIQHYCDRIPYERLTATAQHISTDISFSAPTAAELDGALRRRTQAGPQERDIYASYILRTFLHEMNRRATRLVFQFSFGAEALPFETGSRLQQRTISQIGELIAGSPAVHFQCFLSSRHCNQAMCTLARELPNLSLAGYWWHNFFPDTIRQVIEERLDMLPVNKQIGFFSDAYCLDWVYGKAQLVRRQLARVLVDKINSGQYEFDDAIQIAEAIVVRSSESLLGFRPC